MRHAACQIAMFTMLLAATQALLPPSSALRSAQAGDLPINSHTSAPLAPSRDTDSFRFPPLLFPDQMPPAAPSSGGYSDPSSAPSFSFTDPFHPENPPLYAAVASSDESIYSPLPPPREDEGINMGGTHFSLDFAYANRYVYRGVDHNTVSSRGNSLNLLLEGRLSFDLGAYPHPFVGMFTNLEDNDPVSRFQEIRPYIGATWNFRPFLLEGGQISYLYPQREQLNTAEGYGMITLDDSLLLHSKQPLLAPYFMAAYDYQRSSGWYFEAGIKHDFIFEDLGLVLTIQSDVAYINHLHQLFIFTNTTQETGWQHAEVGLTARYSLNSLINLSKRYGEFDINGYVFYSDKLNSRITANNVVWAGTGIGFRY